MTPETAKEIQDHHDHLETEKAKQQQSDDELAKMACSDTYAVTAQDRDDS